MAWSKKTWLQNIVEHPGRRLVAPTGTTNIYDVTRAEGTVVQAGDQFSVTNMNNLETRIDTGFSDRDAIVGALASLTTSVKTSIVNAINSLVTDLNTKSKPATVGTGNVVATSLTTNQVFTAPSDGEYQFLASFTATSGYIKLFHSNGQLDYVTSPPQAGYENTYKIKVNAGQTITVNSFANISSIEVKFFPQYA